MHKDYYVSINCNGLGLHCLFQETNPQLLLTKLQACFITHIKEKELKGTDHRTFSKSQLLTNYTYRNLMLLSLISSFQNKKKRERRKRRKGREKKKKTAFWALAVPTVFTSPELRLLLSRPSIEKPFI